MARILSLGPWSYSGSNYTITTYVDLEWAETIEGNDSLLEYYVKLRQTPTSSGYKRNVRSGSTVTINGTKVNFSTGDKYNGQYLVTERTLRVPHNVDGTKTVAVSMECNIGGTIKKGSKNVTLTPIEVNNTYIKDGNYSLVGTMIKDGSYKDVQTAIKVNGNWEVL